MATVGKIPFEQKLKEIVDYLNTGDHDETRKLWDVLTALRGPDNGHGKAVTTSVIRHAIGLYEMNRFGVNVERDDDLSVKARIDYDPDRVTTQKEEAEREDSNYSYHFFFHARYAFRALGLQWGKLNGKEGKDEETVRVTPTDQQSDDQV